METCAVCLTSFSTNSSGQLTQHIKKIHDLSLEDYVIKYKLDGNEPNCQCGFCTERPLFIRGAFSRFAKGHNNFEYRQSQYILRNGEPTCTECGSEVAFHRGKPNRFCSFRCSGKQAGFSLQSTQEKIKMSVMTKYGVDNIFKLPAVKSKAMNSLKKLREDGLIKINTSEESRIKRSMASVANWQKPEFREKVSAKIRQALQTPEVRQHRRELLFARFQNDPDGMAKMCLSAMRASKNRYSKLHLRAEKSFELRKHGFIGEQPIGRYCVDEYHPGKKIIIEVNGDYIHAKPEKYKADDRIVLRGNSYLASEKWESDARKTKYLISLGYQVYVIWESDDWVAKKKELMTILYGPSHDDQ